MKKIIDVALIFLLAAFGCRISNAQQSRFAGFKGRGGGTIAGITSDGDTIRFSLPSVFEAFARFESTVEMSTLVQDAVLLGDADADTICIDPSGFSSANTQAAGNFVFQLKDASTFLFGVDSSGNVGIGTDPSGYVLNIARPGDYANLYIHGDQNRLTLERASGNALNQFQFKTAGAGGDWYVGNASTYATSYAGDELFIGVYESGNSPTILLRDGLIGIAGTVSPQHDLSDYSSAPSWVLTDTAYNVDVSTAAQAEDTSAVKMWIDTGQARISFYGPTGHSGYIITNGGHLRVVSANRLYLGGYSADVVQLNGTALYPAKTGVDLGVSGLPFETIFLEEQGGTYASSENEFYVNGDTLFYNDGTALHFWLKDGDK